MNEEELNENLKFKPNQWINFYLGIKNLTLANKKIINSNVNIKEL